MRRTVRVYRLTDSQAQTLNENWDYAEEGESLAGWYWDSFIDYKPSIQAQGPYSTRKIAEWSAGRSAVIRYNWKAV
jgi:hypothetical protein